MMKLAGIDMLPAETGVPWVRRELTEGRGRAKSSLPVNSESCSRIGRVRRLGVERNSRRTNARPHNCHGSEWAATFESTLDPKIQPFLYDHQIDATPVLPGVMGIEAFAEAAKAMAPDWHVASIEDMSFLAPFKFYRHEPRTLTVEAAFHRRPAI